MLTRALALAVTWMAFAGAPTSASGQGETLPIGPDSLTIQMVSRDRWVVDDTSEVVVLVTNHRQQDEVYLDSARLTLPVHLLCDSRSPSSSAEIDQIDLAPGEVAQLRFGIAQVGGGCSSSTGARAGSGDAAVRIWYGDTSEPEREWNGSVVLAWSAPIWVVFIAAVLGVLAAYALLRLAGRTGREDAPSHIGPAWAEILFGVLSVGLAIVLLRLLEPDRQLPFLKLLVADSFGHGLFLGLISDGLGHEFLGLIRRSKRSEPAKPGSPSTPNQETV